MLSRRRFVHLLGLAGGASLAIACGSPAASPAPAAANPTAPPKPAASVGAASPAAAPATAASPVAGGARKQLKVGGLPTVGNAPVILAQQLGYFADEGIDIEIVNFTSGAEVIPPLATGQIDAAASIAPSAGLVNAVARSLPVKIVASNGSIKKDRNLGQIIVRKDLAPATGVVDLKSMGKPIKMAAAAEGIAPHAILMIEVDKAGLQPSDINMNFLGLPDINAAFASKNMDFAASGEPLITIGVQQGLFVRWTPMADLYPNFPYSNFMYGPNLLEKDRDAGDRMMRAYLRGARAYEDAVAKGTDRARIVGFLQQPLSLSPQLFEALQEQGGLAYFNPDGTVDPSPLQPILDYWVKSGATQPGFQLSSLVDNSVAEAAVAKLGKYQ